MRIVLAPVIVAILSGGAAANADAPAPEVAPRPEMVVKTSVQIAHAYDGCRYGHVHARICQEWDQNDKGERICLRYGVKLKCVNYSGSDGLNDCPKTSHRTDPGMRGVDLPSDFRRYASDRRRLEALTRW